MQDSPALPLVRGVMVIHETLLVAVQVPVPDVRIEPPPPSLVSDRVGGSMLIWPKADDAKRTTSRGRMILFMVFVSFAFFLEFLKDELGVSSSWALDAQRVAVSREWSPPPCPQQQFAAGPAKDLVHAAE